MSISEEIQRLSRPWAAKGGKTSRKRTRARMIMIAKDIEKNEPSVKLWRQVGRRQIIRYWKRTEHLSKITRRDHYYALRTAFELTGNLYSVPEPKERERS